MTKDHERILEDAIKMLKHSPHQHQHLLAEAIQDALDTVDELHYALRELEGSGDCG